MKSDRNNMRKRVCIDLGGTNMRVALVENGKVLRKEVIKCPAQEPADVVTQALTDLIGRVFTDDVECISAGVPSVIDPVEGIVYNLNNIPSWREVHLKEILESLFHVPTYIDNDANCFALGVKAFGEGRAYRDMVGVAIGTGLGAGIVINDKLHSGTNTGAGEIGALPFRDANFEYYCSTPFFKRETGSNGKDLAERATLGDKDALAAWDAFGRNVGELMKAVLFAYDPEAIFIGGGIASAFHWFEPAMRDTLKSCPFPRTLEKIVIGPTKLQDAALLGVYALKDYR